ncbi:MAG: imidazole glycerol phosphate synthase subunit HisH [Microthrixaceae bacterium]|nr:imidazole glycerol phosphate synthase subunit HisH [Microthrixaceae bacterium]
MGNLDSVRRALEVAGASPRVTADPRDIAAADAIVLPGVGAFGVAMANLGDLGLVEPLTGAVLDDRVPFLGICLGMQLLAEVGTEFGQHDGLGYIAGSVDLLTPDTPGTRIPHVGWNEVDPTAPHPLFAGIEDRSDFYFVHSYRFSCANSSDALATTPYCGGFASVVARDNIIGVQFHPEKSQSVGLQLLRNFLGMWGGSAPC